ncbi:MAG: hypothetical protein ACOX6J_05555 [Oscillospiraceae bacterium]|jgi:hypothetical protein
MNRLLALLETASVEDDPMFGILMLAIILVVGVIGVTMIIYFILKWIKSGKNKKH